MIWEEAKKSCKRLRRSRLIRLGRLLRKKQDSDILSAGEYAVLKVADWLTLAPLEDDSYWLLLDQFKDYLEDFGNKLDAVKASGQLPAAMLVLSNRRYVTATGLKHFYDLTEGQEIDEIGELVLEVISYPITTILLAEDGRLPKR